MKPIFPADLASRLAAVQDEIAASEPGSNYPNYRQDELRFWSHIPAWIAALPRGIRVLDVGAAYGTLAVFTRRALGAEVIAIDALSAYHPKALFEREGIRHLVRDVERQPLADLGPFDLVIFTEVLEHLNFQPVPTLTKLRDVLVPGGWLMLSTPDAASGWGRQLKYHQSLPELPAVDPAAPWIDDHVWQFDRPELLSSLVAAGFSVQALRHAPGLKPGWQHFNLRARANRRPGVAPFLGLIPPSVDDAILCWQQRQWRR
ncbi:MAG TPA: class I SAM-dependent methyltransferase [Reyranella sp.]|nr:class I SAM-dependent methyltransferase [Reyranella sp.]